MVALKLIQGGSLEKSTAKERRLEEKLKRREETEKNIKEAEQIEGRMILAAAMSLVLGHSSMDYTYRKYYKDKEIGEFWVELARKLKLELLSRKERV